MDNYEYKARNEVLAKKDLIRRERKDEVNLYLRVLAIIVSFLIIVMLLRVTHGGVAPTFTSLLEKLSTSAVPTIPFIDTSFVSLGDWGNLLNPIRDFFGLLLDIVNVGVFLCRYFHTYDGGLIKIKTAVYSVEFRATKVAP